MFVYVSMCVHVFYTAHACVLGYVAGSTDSHGRQRENQTRRGHRRLASRQAKHLSLPALMITQCHRHGPLPRTVGSPSLWPTSVRHLHVLTFARLPAQTSSLAVSSAHAQTSWQECLRTYSISPFPSLLALLASRSPPLFLYPRKPR